ncbi:unnamed protein product [Heligmosomoides polygyrus]|uniref:MADF domain-containing protein n=1 Tax=Heligmosomoides polygyrus TaxID=6339 RepID=A0A183G0I6_HELPZ|nr:unnamed protein product [Heligmosomoides polygyrus]
MREKEAAIISRVPSPTVTTVDGIWKKATDAIRQAAQSELCITNFFGINDENGHLLMDRKKSLKRWRDYFEETSTKITMEENEVAWKKMRPGKATGPDDVAADLWKSKNWHPAEWLAKFFSLVVAEKKVIANERSGQHSLDFMNGTGNVQLRSDRSRQQSRVKKCC